MQNVSDTIFISLNPPNVMNNNKNHVTNPLLFVKILLKCYRSKQAERKAQMQEPSDVLRYLEEIRKENGKRIWSFRSLTRYLNAKAKARGVPVCGQFELTPLCNFSCKMCYVHLNPDQLRGRALTSVESWKSLMHQAWEAGMLYATLSGGECLTYPGFDELYLYLQNLGISVSILTNGYLLEFFRQHKPSMIQITLYGWNDDVYERVTGVRGFTVVRENIQKAIDAGFNVKLVITPNKYLGEDVLETIRVARSITSKVMVNSSVMAPREETGRSQQRDNPDVDIYVRLYRLMNDLDGIQSKEIDPDKLPPAGGPCHESNQCGLGCGGGRSGFVVDWKGILMPCNSLDMVRADPWQKGFMDAWSKIHQQVVEWPCVPECEGCAYSGVCHHCAAIMLQYADPGKQPIQMCEEIRHLVRHGVVHLPDCE